MSRSQFISLDQCPDLAHFDVDEHETSRPMREDIAAALDLGRGIRAIMHLCVPSAGSNGGSRRFVSGYVRFLALAWVAVPDLFTERTDKELARSFGVSRQRFEFHVAYWQRVLAGEHAAGPAIPLRAAAPVKVVNLLQKTGRNGPSAQNRARVLPSKKRPAGSARATGSIVRLDPESY